MSSLTESYVILKSLFVIFDTDNGTAHFGMIFYGENMSWNACLTRRYYIMSFGRKHCEITANVVLMCFELHAIMHFQWHAPNYKATIAVSIGHISFSDIKCSPGFKLQQAC